MAFVKMFDNCLALWVKIKALTYFLFANLANLRVGRQIVESVWSHSPNGITLVFHIKTRSAGEQLALLRLKLTDTTPNLSKTELSLSVFNFFKPILNQTVRRPIWFYVEFYDFLIFQLLFFDAISNSVFWRSRVITIHSISFQYIPVLFVLQKMYMFS